MKATQLSTTPGGAPAGPSPLTVRTPAAGPRPGVFRETLYARLAPGEGAEELLVDAAACLMDATFEKYSYDAIPAGAGPLRASVEATSDGEGLVVTLDAPRRVRHLDASHPSGSYTAELYRMDGDTPADSPTVVAREGSTIGAVLQRAFDGAATAMGAMEIVPNTSTGIQIGVSVPGYTVDLTDRRFLLRLRSSGGSLASLTPANLDSLTVESYPTNPRIGIAFPAPGPPATPAVPEEASIVWRTAGEIGNGTPASAGEVAAGEALGAELGRAASRFAALLGDASPGPAPPPTLPPALDVALVVESDAPCRFRLGSFEVAYSLARESFPGGEEKQVLRFPAGAAEAREVPIAVPAGVSVLSATLHLAESLRGDRAGLTSDGALLAPLAGRTGVRVHLERRGAQRFTPAQAVTASGAAIAILPLAAGGRARLELREDASGTPAGRTLGEGDVPLPLPGHPGWAVVRFEEPVIVPSQPHWLVLSCGTAASVWLTAPGEDPVRLLLDDLVTAIPGEAALHGLLSLGGSGASAPPLDLSLGGHHVASGPVADGRRSHDLAPALAAVLAADPATSGLLSLPVRCAGLGPGSVTAYPPRIVYER